MEQSETSCSRPQIGRQLGDGVCLKPKTLWDRDQQSGPTLDPRSLRFQLAASPQFNDRGRFGLRIGRLRGGTSAKKWLDTVKEEAVLSPRSNEEWISLHGLRALKVRNRNADSGESENICSLNGEKHS